jgi:ubiquinone/menaquinone biosynthesis C-methylase UbiE
VSTFTPYDHVSSHYDSTRVPGGIEILLGCLAGLGRPLGDLSLLDAGCGTGAYSEALLGHVGRIDAIDLSPGMLEAARAKLGDAADGGHIAFHQGSIAELPFEDASFDAVMTNQVLHHLDHGEDPGFPVLRQAIGEFARVLRPGGGLVVNTCSRAQLLEGYWFWCLALDAGQRY